jgi:hypothetical protein
VAFVLESELSANGKGKPMPGLSLMNHTKLEIKQKKTVKMLEN